MSPISIVGIDGPPPPRLLFPLEFSSRLILIIGIQSSSGPSPLPLPSAQDSAPPAPLHVLRPEDMERSWWSRILGRWQWQWAWPRSEEHTSELQSLRHLVCRLLLEKKNKNNN